MPRSVLLRVCMLYAYIASIVMLGCDMDGVVCMVSDRRRSCRDVRAVSSIRFETCERHSVHDDALTAQHKLAQVNARARAVTATHVCDVMVM